MDTICPAGNIYTSAEQAGRFFEMLLSGGKLPRQTNFKRENNFRATLLPQELTLTELY